MSRLRFYCTLAEIISFPPEIEYSSVRRFLETNDTDAHAKRDIWISSEINISSFSLEFFLLSISLEISLRENGMKVERTADIDPSSEQKHRSESAE